MPNFKFHYVDSHVLGRRHFQFKRVVLVVLSMLLMAAGYAIAFSQGTTYPTTDNMYYSTLGSQLLQKDQFKEIFWERVGQATSKTNSLTGLQQEQRSKTMSVLEERQSKLFGPSAYFFTSALNAVFTLSIAEDASTPYYFSKSIRYNLGLLLGPLLPLAIFGLLLYFNATLRIQIATVVVIAAYVAHLFIPIFEHFVYWVSSVVWPGQTYNFEFWMFGFSPRFLVLPIVISALYFRLSDMRGLVYLTLSVSLFFAWGSALAAVALFALSDFFLSSRKALSSYSWWLPFSLPIGLVVVLVQPYTIIHLSSFLILLVILGHRLLRQQANNAYTLDHQRLLKEGFAFYFAGLVLTGVDAIFGPDSSYYSIFRGFEQRVFPIQQPILAILVVGMLVPHVCALFARARFWRLTVIATVVIFSSLFISRSRTLPSEVSDQLRRNDSVFRELEHEEQYVDSITLLDNSDEGVIYFLTERQLQN